MQVGELRAEARGEAGRVDAAEAETGEDAAGVVDAAGVAGITPVEIGQPLALLHRTEGVDLRRIADVIVHVDRAADALFVRLPPALYRVRHRERRIRRLERESIGTLAGARGGLPMRELAGEDDRALVVQRDAPAGAGLVGVAVPGIILAELAIGFHPRLVVEDDVDDAGDRVGAILGRRAVA